MINYKEIIDNFSHWSFSRISGYETCPHMWMKTYIEKDKGLENAFSQMGTFCHELLESENRSDITPKEMSDQFNNGFYNTVTIPFPPNNYVNLKINYFNKIGMYFMEYAGVTGEVLSVERKFEYILPNGIKFIGYIDLETKTNVINVVDHKVSAFFKPKDLEKKKHQMILYAPAILAEYGELPDAGYFHFLQHKAMVKPPRDSQFIKVDINQEAMVETLDWAVDVINTIRNDNEFKPVLTESNKDDKLFFCQYICSHRESCVALKEILK